MQYVRYDYRPVTALSALQITRFLMARFILTPPHFLAMIWCMNKYIKPQSCSVCGTVYLPRSWNSLMTPYCSTACKVNAREARKKRVSVVCVECGKPFELSGRKLYQAKNGRTYCTKDCSRAYAARVSSETMARTNRKYASSRMRKQNPMATLSFKNKMIATLKGRPFLHRGGNGKIPRHQRQMFDALIACGFQVRQEHGISTKTVRGLFTATSLPTCYKPDISHLASKTAVEIDGCSHLTKLGKERDIKKTAILSALGWKVLRFTNADVDRDLIGCVQTVASTIWKSLETTITLPIIS